MPSNTIRRHSSFLTLDQMSLNVCLSIFVYGIIVNVIPRNRPVDFSAPFHIIFHQISYEKHISTWQLSPIITQLTAWCLFSDAAYFRLVPGQVIISHSVLCDITNHSSPNFSYRMVINSFLKLRHGSVYIPYLIEVDEQSIIAAF